MSTAIVTITSLVLSFMVIRLFFNLRRSKPNSFTPQSPPRVFSWVPSVVNLWRIATDGPAFLLNATSVWGWKSPFQFSAGLETLYVFTAPSHVSYLLKPVPGLNTNRALLMALRDIIGFPRSYIDLYMKDNSGPFRRPNKGSEVPAEKRLRFLIWNSAQRYLIGSTGVSIGRVYKSKMMELIHREMDISHDWKKLDDLFAMIQTNVCDVSFETFLGRQIFKVAPDICEQFREFHDAVPSLIRRYPRWLFPSPYNKREVILTSLKKWNRLLQDEGPDCNLISPDDPDWEPYFGSKFIKDNYRILNNFGGITEEARACGALGVIFSLATNAIPMVFWAIFEVYRDPVILAQVRSIAALAYDPETRELDPNIHKSPLLQSITAEALRMRVHGILLANLERDFTLDGWTVPKSGTIGMCSTITLNNAELWNTGKDNEWPLTRFWSERFIVDPKDPNSGPLRNKQAYQDHQTAGDTNCNPGDESPYFSLKGLDGIFVPFGAGPAMCPGRHFAQYEIIVTLVLFVLNYDIQVLKPQDWDPSLNTRYFPMGALPPRDEVPCLIRKRSEKPREV